jgi:hypothetical protein
VPHKDITQLGVVNMAGNMGEFIAESAFHSSSRCHQATDLKSPRCYDKKNYTGIVRGSNWTSVHAPSVENVDRPDDRPNPVFGIRCVRTPPADEGKP